MFCGQSMMKQNFNIKKKQEFVLLWEGYEIKDKETQDPELREREAWVMAKLLEGHVPNIVTEWNLLYTPKYT